MSLAIVRSRVGNGLAAPEVGVEVHLSNGLPSFSIVGLPEAAVRESRERVRSALLNSGFDFPTRRITVNLAPADLPKEGGRFDLPIALGILAASDQLPPACLDGLECLGELGLGGELRPVRGVLTATLAAVRCSRTLVLPLDNAEEAALVAGVDLLPAQHLTELTAHLSGKEPIVPVNRVPTQPKSSPEPDLCDVRGQHLGRRGVELASAGGHDLLLIGPPGCGKTMLAERLPGLLPPMTEAEALETACIYSVSRAGFEHGGWRTRPFRSPHHSASAVALVGGGSRVLPGEISLAHNGVLFLDELTEFDRRVLDQLREPLEAGSITVARASRSVVYPSRFQLVAAMNPCPCGYAGDPSGRCRCSSERQSRYQRRISGPLLDRIDLQIRIASVELTDLRFGSLPGESTDLVRQRVEGSRALQFDRCGMLNARIPIDQLEKVCAVSVEGRRLLAEAIETLGFTARAYHRILRLSRTVSDLAGSDTVQAEHIAESLQFRFLDRASSWC